MVANPVVAREEPLLTLELLVARRGGGAITVTFREAATRQWISLIPGSGPAAPGRCVT